MANYTDYNEDEKEQIRDIDLRITGENDKLVSKFGASRISDLKIDLPDFYTFKNGLIYSHRDFDLFMKNLNNGTKSAIVSGFNPSSSIHIGHIGVFDTNLFFQKKYKIPVFIPLSDDESYVSGKVENQNQSFINSLKLIRSLIAFGYDISNTHVIIDSVYTNIYNLAIKLSKGLTLSEIKDVYGYTNDKNAGLHFYPAIQSAHVIYPQTIGIPNVLVPIGPDEDAHIRVSRDLATKYGYNKVSVLHSLFLPALNGDSKMSKSKGNAVFLLDDREKIKKLVMDAFTGGRATLKEHKLYGGIPEIDIPFLYLKYLFMADDESKSLYNEYRSGKLTSGDMKNLLLDKIYDRVDKFKEKYNKVDAEDIEKVVMKNSDVDIKSIIYKFDVLD